MSDITNIINTISDTHKKSFISSYGSDLVISIITISIFIITIMYFYVKNNLPAIREKWPTEKCNPLYMPFAGLVLDKSNKSSLELIENNFSGCINNILESIAHDALAPLYYTKQATTDNMNQSLNAVNNIRAFFDKIRNDITNMVHNVMGRTLNVMMPPLQMAISTKDSLSKVKGVYTSGMYFTMANYIIMQSLFKNIIRIIVASILMTLIAIIIGLMSIPFIGQALATPLIGMAIAIIIPTVIIITKSNNIFKMNISSDMPHW